uniref:Uncharacterized protein n=1 Tax=Vespula pensylvanica TaxID=30213 RepID=A0A834UFM3_VESPE|nr:hypothetical protein H0235_003993 [Vespula pensylvanica]
MADCFRGRSVEVKEESPERSSNPENDEKEEEGTTPPGTTRGGSRRLRDVTSWIIAGRFALDSARRGWIIRNALSEPQLKTET